jgi:hypothetical protein
MHTESDQRQYPRHAVLFDAKYTIKSGTYRDSVSNVSEGGIYIYTRRKIEQGQRISLRFPVFAFDRSPRVEGMVVRSEDNGFAVMFDSPREERIPKGI